MGRGASIGALLLATAVAAGTAAADRENTSGRARPPIFVGDPAALFGEDAYPPEAIRQHQQGRVSTTLWIDDHGKVVSCTIAASSGSAALDGATCRIALAGIAFTPAADRNGRPVPSSYPLSVRWVLPAATDTNTTVMMPVDLVWEQVVDGDGHRRSCTFRANGRVSPYPRPCDDANSTVEPARSRLPAAMKGQPFVLFTEARQEFGGLPVPLTMKEADVATLVRVVLRFDVTPEGRAINCRQEGDASLGSMGDPCRDGRTLTLPPNATAKLPLAATWSFTMAARPLPSKPGI